jgi:hypothetical protein
MKKYSRALGQIGRSQNGIRLIIQKDLIKKLVKFAE